MTGPFLSTKVRLIQMASRFDSLSEHLLSVLSALETDFWLLRRSCCKISIALIDSDPRIFNECYGLLTSTTPFRGILVGSSGNCAQGIGELSLDGATFWLMARSPQVDHNHDRERTWKSHTSSIRSSSIDWRLLACRRNSTRSILPRIRQPWALGTSRYGMG